MSAPEAGVATAGISGGIPPASMGDPSEQGAEPLDLSHGENGGTVGCPPL